MWWRFSPYAKEESMVSMVVISLQWQQQISPSGGGRWVLPPPPPQKIMGKIGHPFSIKMKVSIRSRRRGDTWGPNVPWWRGLPGGPRHLSLFDPRGSPHVLPPRQMLLKIKYWRYKNPWLNWGPEGPWNIKIQKHEIFCLSKIKYQGGNL
jgi:hypothetical protein